jgi:hypothetical protein
MDVDLSAFQLDHLSVSQLRTWLMCGYRWYYDNATGTDRTNAPGWSGRLRGSALDAAANAHFGQKVEDGVGLPARQFVEVAVATHDEGVDTTMFDISEEKSRDRIARIAKEYRETFGELLQPWAGQAPQEKFIYQDEGLLVPIHGIIDLRTTSQVVVDNKVKRKKNVPTQLAIDTDLQLTTYAMATGYSRVALAVMVDEDKTHAVYLESSRTANQVANIRARYNAMARGIRAGVLMPAPEGAWYCCEKWCSHWGYCPYGGGEDRPIPGME